MKRLTTVFLLILIFNVTYCFAKSTGGTMSVQNGKKVTFDYTLTVDGKVIDSSKGQSPVSYTHGENDIIPGLSEKLEGMCAGEEKEIVLTPEQGYGMPNPDAFKEVPRSALPADVEPRVGTLLQVSAPGSQPGVVRIAELKGESVLLDFNHPLAGKVLNFQIKVISVQ